MPHLPAGRCADSSSNLVPGFRARLPRDERIPFGIPDGVEFQIDIKRGPPQMLRSDDDHMLYVVDCCLLEPRKLVEGEKELLPAYDQPNALTRDAPNLSDG